MFGIKAFVHDTPLFSLLTFDADSDCCLVRDGRAVSFFKFGIQVSFNVKKGRFYGYENRKILLRQLFIWLFRGNAIYALIFVAYSLSSLIAHNKSRFSR